MNINLNCHRSKDVIVFSGRPKGQALRQKLELNAFDKTPDTAVVNVPDDVVSLNSSFFLGLFAESVKSLGEKQFRTKYIFECPDEIREDIDDGIQQALRESNPLPNS